MRATHSIALLTDISSNCTNYNYVACKMRHLSTNLVVPELNLTCLAEIKQQHYKDMKHYVACKTM
jgi:hypothetical protein